MQPANHERRQDRTPDEEAKGLAARSLREGVPVDELELRLKNPDGSVGPDAARIEDLRTGAKKKLLAMAGYTTEKAAEELSPIKPVADLQNLEVQAQEKVLTIEQKTALFSTLEDRIKADTQRYEGIKWADVKSSLEAADTSLLYGLFQMEENGHKVGVKMGKRDGRKGFRFDSCSASSPADVRDVDYPQAEEIAEKEWGVPLMPTGVFKELQAANIITENGTWSHLKTDAAMLKKGLSWCGDAFGVRKLDALNHSRPGGFRCSLWVPAV